jgi:uncharacterized membrane protein YgdD (TMEM256/DUF423 family)
MGKTALIAGAFLGMTAVLLGAFGAHGLRELLDAKGLQVYETGIKYQFYHALFLLAIASINWNSGLRARWSCRLAIIGTVLFSGSLYLLSAGILVGIDFRPLGLITPIGGVLLVIAWLLLLIDFTAKKS